jgi:LmbE family N-acetylglucosaminyl deacetylase
MTTAGWQHRVLRDVRTALAVLAHPDDESFGLGAVLDLLTAAGGGVAVLCFTHGEASTLRADSGDLATTREAEFTAAARVLGLTATRLLGYPDGGLSAIPLYELAVQVREMALDVGASHLVAFDIGGVSGHPDHARATGAALAAASPLGLAVLGWTLPETVAGELNAEFGTAFTGRKTGEISLTLEVDRARQRRAIACHRSQSASNPVLWRRLELLGDCEHLRVLRA